MGVARSEEDVIINDIILIVGLDFEEGDLYP